MSRRAVFFDRDGTLCKEVGYVNHPSRLELMPDAPGVLKAVREGGFLAIVATNQAGAARGYFPPHVIDETHRRLRAMLAERGAGVDAIYACRHHPNVGPPGLRRDCNCRKPGPGMLLQGAAEHDIDLSRSYMVGDSFKDVGAGRAAGVAGTVLLRTGYGRGEMLWKGGHTKVWPDHVADDLTDAWRWISAREEAVER
jgi:D-glycero-D-manno-heptose 1,7-bisphosphate phosphatase